MAATLGWDPASSPFWDDGYALASLAGKVSEKPSATLRSLVAAVVSGILTGYGARLAYGCNIGAFFSGVASASLHGWVWIACAIPGNIIGVRLRPLSGQSSD